jgi:4-amino-4-deoxy-L-arabinose transferase-like glycosyltransferase
VLDAVLALSEHQRMLTRRRARRALLLALLPVLWLGACSRSAPEAASLVEPGEAMQESSHALTTVQAQAALPLERQLIRTVSLELQVESAASARSRVEALLAPTAGFIEALESTRYSGSQRVQLTLRVPKLQLDALLVQLRKLGSVQHESQAVEDVTRKYVDVEARLRNMGQTEQRLLALLQNTAGGLSDVLAVERELNRVREEHEVLTSELRALKEQVALSTLKLGLSQESDPEPPPSMWTPWRRLGRNAGQILAESLGALLGFGAGLLTWCLYVLPWLPLALLIWFGARRWWRRRRRDRVG